MSVLERGKQFPATGSPLRAVVRVPTVAVQSAAFRVERETNVLPPFVVKPMPLSTDHDIGIGT
jgi:hypothetical protein